MDINRHYHEASTRTALSLRNVLQARDVRELSRLTLPEIDAVVERVARLIPAGNVPGLILSGLARLNERRPSTERVQRDVNRLFAGVDEALDRVEYLTLFAGPAAVIWGYQSLLKLAGKDPNDAFPEGTWQFYVDYALREDTARHANETHGFDTALNRSRVTLSLVDRVTAWTMAAIYLLHRYDALLANEWRERVALDVLRGVIHDEAQVAKYFRAWEKQRPFSRSTDAVSDEDFAAYRHRKFDIFTTLIERNMGRRAQREWHAQFIKLEQRDLQSYQQQMTILAYLEPGSHGETRVRFPLAEAHIGLIVKGHYYLIPACIPGTSYPADPATVHAQVASIMRSQRKAAATALAHVAVIRRGAWAGLREQMSPTLQAELNALRHAPILLNTDRPLREQPLALVRQAERGIGDHPLTIFDTGTSFVFDQSHIFFDGSWGAALAEILTNEALAWAYVLHDTPPPAPAAPPPKPIFLPLAITPAEQECLTNAPRVLPEVSGETEAVNLRAVLDLRKLLHKRNEELQLTVNDLLVLYRAIHAATYVPGPALQQELEQGRVQRRKASREAYEAALAALDAGRSTNPSVLIPVDASKHSPRERLHPLTFEIPLAELDLLRQHTQTWEALLACETGGAFKPFDAQRRMYFASLAALGKLLARIKICAAAGESASVGSIRLLAHLPRPVQYWLDRIPQHVDMLNDLLKGREVFSNVGAVVPGSTLCRFITAKDDNEKKTLAWGVITSADGVMRLSLRDFRPHVALLIESGHQKTAQRIVQDYLEQYAYGLNNYVLQLSHIARVGPNH